MSHPYIIWTMRRTGGTSLATLLQRYAPFPRVDHEPFNSGRAWNPMVKQFGTDPTATEPALRKALEARPVIKNCYDLHPTGLHALLMRLSSELGYRHVILDRRNEADRLLSLVLAAQTGSWGRKSARAIYAEILDGSRKLDPIPEARLLKQMRNAAKRRAWLAKTMAAAGLTPHTVHFEEIYAPQVDGEARIREIFRFLDIPMEPAEKFEADLHAAVHERAQGTADVLPLVPNIAELRALLVTQLGDAGAHGGTAPDRHAPQDSTG